MKRILSVILCLMPFMAFADWECYPDDVKSMEKNLFYLNNNVKTNGIHLISVGCDLTDIVRLRLYNGELDIDCMIIKAQYSEGGKYFIQFFDDDHYFLGEHCIGNVVADFTGELFGNLKLDSATFNKIKQYSLILRLN